MHYSKYSNRSTSSSSATSINRNPMNKLKSNGRADFEYVGRLVTRERPVPQKSKSVQQSHVFPQNKHKYCHAMASHCPDINEDVSGSSSEDESDGLSKPLGVIRISDRHLREIYRLPTPSPKIKRVYHRLRSPEPKVIERVFVRRPPPQIIENIIEVPPEKVRIVTREKYLEKPPPITRSKLVHLKSRRQRRQEEEEEQGQEQEQQQQQLENHVPSQHYHRHQKRQQENYVPSQQYSQPQQQQTYVPSQQYYQSQQQPTTGVPHTAPQYPSTTMTTTLVYPPQPNMHTVGYYESPIPPHIMFNSQQPFQISPQQIFNNQISTSSPYDSAPQQSITYQMAQPTSYQYPQQQPPILNPPYGYTQH